MTATEAIAKWTKASKLSHWRSGTSKTARITEKMVLTIAASFQIKLELTSHTAPVDLVGELQVEVKASNWVKTNGGKGRYQFNLKPHQVSLSDFIVCVCLTGTDEHCFVIPASEVTGRTIEITTQEPRKYRGKYARFYEQWDQMKGAK